MSIDQNVSHPSYYGGKDDPYETIKVIDAWGLDKNFCLGNVIKYISRAGKKDGNSLLQDLMKAQFYLNYEVEKLHKYESFQSLLSKVRSSEPLPPIPLEEIRKGTQFVIDWLAKHSDEPLTAPDTNSTDHGSGHGKKYNCQPDECSTCKYSDTSDYEDCDSRTCLEDDDCGVRTIDVPDDVKAAIDKVADYFIDSDTYELGFSDDGDALLIAPADYDWDEWEDDDDEECD